MVCERCGYNLTGLSNSTACPECGTPLSESLSPDSRKQPQWETAQGIVNKLLTLIQTLLFVIFRPSKFYRTLATRVVSSRSSYFALLCMCLSALGLGFAWADYHLWLSLLLVRAGGSWVGLVLEILWRSGFCLAVTAGTYLAVLYLTGFEARLRGFRFLPQAARRTMQYHTAHLLPVSLGAVAIVLSHHWLSYDYDMQIIYLYCLCGYVVIAGIYLFYTYWLAMRNTFHANF